MTTHVRDNGMPLADLLTGCTEAAIPNVTITSVALDSRQVRPGALFLACPGLRQHGLEHAAMAIEAGAEAVAWDADTSPKLATANVHVAHLSQQAGLIAARMLGHPSTAMFTTGITGTDGKTSCAWLLMHALESVGQHCGYVGTLGHGFAGDRQAAAHTTPDAVTLQYQLAEFVAHGATAAALEVSSHALAQGRARGVAFDVAVLTHIGRDHLDYHGSMADYVAAKRRLFDMPGLGRAVLNVDDPHGRQWLTDLPTGVRPVAYGRSADVTHCCDDHVAIADVVPHSQGLAIVVRTSWGQAHIDSRLIGDFNADNLAAVLAVLLLHGVPIEQAAHALGHVGTVPGRMEVVSGRARQPLVVVDFAHTPNALAHALRAVAAHVSGRIHCVFGCGGDRDRGKRALMGAAAAQHADMLWVTDDNPRHESPAAIVADILTGFDTAAVAHVVEHDRRVAIASAICDAGSDDAVLVAGKGHETHQQIGDMHRPHDDRMVARQALEAA